MEEANFLTKYATRVQVLHRRDQLRASKIMQDRARRNPKIEFLWNSVIEEILDAKAGKVTGVRLRNVNTNELTVYEAGGVFILDRNDGKFLITRFAKSRSDFFVSRAFDGCGLKDCSFATRRFDLLLQPLKIFVSFFVGRKHIDRVLDCYRAQLLQLAPNAHAQVCGLGRQLMDQ